VVCAHLIKSFPVFTYNSVLKGQMLQKNIIFIYNRRKKLEINVLFQNAKNLTNFFDLPIEKYYKI
ncbi:MAG: hypothetical protein IJY73_09180, partial [Oscillospiraceae bacterium]|nr:hypothetical protein [Oscillospiraceae bacterium]